MKPIRVLLLAGGESDEHDISLLSARSVMRALDGSRLETAVRVIARDGRWLSPEASVAAVQEKRVERGEIDLLEAVASLQGFDVIFPILHGPNGEDGTIQGLLELAGVPYVGSGVLSSALCMDKVACKDLLATHGFDQVPYLLVTRSEILSNIEEVRDRTSKAIEGPWFVKPANLGSSIGIGKAKTVEELGSALTAASKFDRRVLVESAVEGARELEVALIGNETVEASPVGEIEYDAEFYDYETKYTDGRATLRIPAELPDDVASSIQSEARRAFLACDCAGFARADYFYQPSSGRILINELNTIPGFTPFSMFTKLFEHAGSSYPAIIERLVSLALERHHVSH